MPLIRPDAVAREVALASLVRAGRHDVAIAIAREHAERAGRLVVVGVLPELRDELRLRHGVEEEVVAVDGDRHDGRHRLV